MSEFLAEEKRVELSEALLDTKLEWQRTGPANKRCYDVVKGRRDSGFGSSVESMNQRVVYSLSMTASISVRTF